MEIVICNAPLYSGAAASHRRRVVVRGAPIGFDMPDPKKITNDAYDFSFAARAEGDGAMSMEWTYQRSGPPVAADKVPGIIRDSAALSDEIWWTWNLVP